MNDKYINSYFPDITDKANIEIVCKERTSKLNSLVIKKFNEYFENRYNNNNKEKTTELIRQSITLPQSNYTDNDYIALQKELIQLFINLENKINMEDIDLDGVHKLKVRTSVLKNPNPKTGLSFKQNRIETNESIHQS